MEEKPITLHPGSVKPTRVLHHRWRVQRVLRSDLCGCLHCFAVFGPGDIREWTDTDESGKRATALCPRCGIDSVLGSASGFPPGRPFLERMHTYWFME